MLWQLPVQAARIKDIVDIKGARQNQLVGYGLVVGLDGTGDLDFMPIELRQRATLLHVALEQLPNSQREVIELHWFQERPYAEIAEIVGTSECSVGTAATGIYTTLKQLLVSEIRGDE